MSQHFWKGVSYLADGSGFRLYKSNPHMYALYWRFYSESAPAQLQKQLADLFTEAEAFLSHLAVMYGLAIPVPRIFVVEDQRFNAWATPTREIHVTTGLVQWAETISTKAAQSFTIQFPDLKLNGMGMARFAVFWVLAHEFFHIARGHFEILAESDTPERYLGIEADADGMATAGLYRLLLETRSQLNLNSSKLDVKRQTLLLLSWPIRDLIGIEAPAFSPGSRCYPPWHVRLFAVAYKLALLDAESTGPIDRNFKSDFEALGLLLKDLMQTYGQRHCLVPTQDALLSFVTADNLKAYFSPTIMAVDALRSDFHRFQHLRKLSL
jgi:hypothetical protein